VKTVFTTHGAGTTTDGVGISVPPPTVTSDPYPLTTVPVSKREPQSLVAASGCTTTIFRAVDWDLGPTKTAYVWTETATSTADCGGCDYIVDRVLNGLGPAVYVYPSPWLPSL
jgi:hypothetical protein